MEDAVKYLKDANQHSYGRKGQDVVDMNNAAVDAGVTAPIEVSVPEEWAHATTGGTREVIDRPAFISDVCDVMNRQEGDDLPVSTFKGIEDGTFPTGTSKYERPTAAISVPEWIPQPVRRVLPARHDPSDPRHGRRSGKSAGRLHRPRFPGPGKRTQIPHGHRPAGLLRLRHLRQYLPGPQ